MESQQLVTSATPMEVARETSYEIWRSKRNDFVGSSDIATVMGISRYETPLELWARRTGKVKKEWQDSRAARYGRKVESKILELFQEDHPELQIYPNNLTYVSKKYPFALATPDSFAIRSEDMELGLVEIKHTSFGFEQWGPTAAPLEAHIQVVWQMGILEKLFTYICAIVGGQANEEIAPLFTFDDVANGIFMECLEKSDNFVKCVQQDIPPGAGPGDLKIVQRIIKQSEGAKELPAELQPDWDRYVKLSREKTKLESDARVLKKKTDDLKARLLLAAGGHKIAEFSDGTTINLSQVQNKGSVTEPYSYWKIEVPKEEK